MTKAEIQMDLYEKNQKISDKEMEEEISFFDRIESILDEKN